MIVENAQGFLRRGDAINLSLEMQMRRRSTVLDAPLSENLARIKVRWAF